MERFSGHATTRLTTRLDFLRLRAYGFMFVFSGGVLGKGHFMYFNDWSGKISSIVPHNNLPCLFAVIVKCFDCFRRGLGFFLGKSSFCAR